MARARHMPGVLQSARSRNTLPCGHPAGPAPDPARRRTPTASPATPTASSGPRPECDLLRPHFDSGLRWPDENNPQPGDWCWDGGVAGGVTWDGTFYRDQPAIPPAAILLERLPQARHRPRHQERLLAQLRRRLVPPRQRRPRPILTGAAPRLTTTPVPALETGDRGHHVRDRRRR